MTNFDIYGSKQDPAQPIQIADTSQPAKAGTDVGYVEDVIKGTGGGLARGLTGLAGLPGTAQDLVRGGIDYFLPPSQKQLEARQQAPNLLPSQPAVQAAVEKNVTGKFYEPQTLPGQYASTIAEFAPGALVPGSAAARVANTVIPGAFSETAGQITKGTAAEPWARGIAGVAGGVGAAKAITPAAPASAGRQAAVGVLEREGIPLSAGERTGSAPIRWAESVAADMPGSAGRAAEMNAATRGALDKTLTERTFDRAELTRRGIPPEANLPDPSVAVAGGKSLSDKYNQILAGYDLLSDSRLVNGIYGRVAKYENDALTPTKEIARMRDKITDTLLKGQGSMTGAEYQGFRSQLGSAAKDTVGDTAKRTALSGMKRDLDAAMERNLPTSVAEQLKENNRRYSNMKTLEGAVAKADENLSPQAVAQAVRSRRAGDFSKRQGNLDELAHAANMVIKPLPQSGTGPRTQMQQLFSLPSMLSAGGGGTIGGMVGGIPGALIGAGLPLAASRFVVSKGGQKYLGNQLLPQRGRDVVAQTLAQKAVSQPSIIDRNERERRAYEEKRKNR
jgi:hypothetical protein